MAWKFNISEPTAATTEALTDEQFVFQLSSLEDLLDDCECIDYEQVMKDEAEATEGFLDGLIGDIDTALIGAIIAYARNNLMNVKKQVDLCKSKLKYTSDEDIEKRTMQKLLRVRSKYLPEYKTFMNGAAGLTKMLNALAAKPDTDGQKLSDYLKGTMFWDDGKGKKKGQQDTNWEYAGIRSIGNFMPYIGIAAKVAERFYFEPSSPVGERGWSNRKAFEEGLKAMDALLAAIEKAIKAVAKADNKDYEANRVVKWAEKEVVYLGRGLTTAIRKLYAGGFVRFFSNRFIH